MQTRAYPVQPHPLEDCHIEDSNEKIGTSSHKNSVNTAIPQRTCGHLVASEPNYISQDNDLALVWNHVDDKSIGPVTPNTQQLRRSQCLKEVSAQQNSNVRMYTADFEHTMNVMDKLTAFELWVQAIFNEKSGQVLKYRKLLNHPRYKEVWSHSSANKFSRLAQGIGIRIKGTNTIFVTTHQDIPVELSQLISNMPWNRL
jgi:hypothetical protein